jgi:glycosyltransferase involved in cell wall biosynthesis
MTIAASDVSVVMSVRDGARHLAAAIESVLAQTTPPGEFVVVDDGSRDGTAEVLESFGAALRSFRQPPRGTAAGLNRGIAASSGCVLAFLDADDLWTPRALEARLERLTAADEPVGVWGATVQFVSPELPEAEARRLRVDPGPSSAPLPGALLVRRVAVDRVGGLDESLPSAEGIDWVTRVRDARLPLVPIDDVVLRRRLHAGNVGRALPRETTLAALRKVVRAHHERRRDGSDSPPEIAR